jgi:MoxR-like ATPase
LVRLVVRGIEDREKFNEMIAMDSTPYEGKIEKGITDAEYKNWSKEIDQIAIPENVLNVIHVIKNKIELHNQNVEIAGKQIYISDRRWRKIVRLMRSSAFLNDRKEVDLMDCFLIKHCIWNEEEQIQAVSSFVNDAIEEYGYTKEIDFTSIRDELDNFSTDIDEETKFEKDTRVEVLEPVYDGYYEILNPPDQNANLIKQNEFDNLSNDNRHMYLQYWKSNYNEARDYYSYDIRNGNSKFSLFINDAEYTLKTMIQGDKRLRTRKPNPILENNWDGRVDNYLSHSNEIRTQINQYKDKDLEHLRTNLFVMPELANIVENHLAATMKDVEKLELKIREIQNGYKKLKDEEVVLNA